jgi:MFS family permease
VDSTAADAPERGRAGPDAYRRFGLGIASWFGAFGMQGVLFSWLVVGELQARAEWVGIAQTATFAPSLLLLLVGGAAADRADTQRVLVRLHMAAALPPLLLALAVQGGWLRMALLLAYGVAMGTITAFAMPARDTLLYRVAGADMMRAVTGMTAVQFGSQALGTLVAGGARWVGSAPMLLVQALVFLGGALATSRIPPAPPLPRDGARTPALRDIADGLKEVAREPRLRSPIALVMAVGVFFIGPFLVTFPLLVRDHYGGGVAELSLVLMTFPVGTIAGSLAIRARGGIRRKGRAALLALGSGAAMLAIIGSGLPFAGMLAATTLWGLAGAFFINCSRTLVQENAPPAHRARVLSVFQLGFLGGGPVGSLTAGLLAGRVGPLGTLQLCGATMLVFVTLVWLLSSTSRME